MPKKAKSTDKLFPADTKHKLDFLENRVIDVENQYKRVLADYQNLEKRTVLHRAEPFNLATAKLISHLLPVLDDLYRAQDHLNDPGLKLVIDHFLKVLKDEGVTEINALDQDFSPLTMECIEIVAGPDHQVVSILTRGYQLGDVIIRPAGVTVGSTPKNK